MDFISLTELFLINAGVLLLIGLFGIITRKNIFKILLSINIFQTGVNLLLIGIGYVENGEAPIITGKINNLIPFVDPLPQALVLTSIVIGFGTTAVGLMVALRYFKSHKTLEFERPLSSEELSDNLSDVDDKSNLNEV